MTSRRFDVFGRLVQISASETGWDVFYLGTDGKRRPAKDIVIPPDVAEKDLARYLGDLCHEWASERSSEVRRLD